MSWLNRHPMPILRSSLLAVVTITISGLRSPYNDDFVFRIDPTPMPVWSIVIYNLLFAAVGYGFHWALMQVTHGEAVLWICDVAPVAVTLFTCGIFTAVVYWTFANAWRLGPWLIYDKATGQVELPRRQGDIRQKRDRSRSVRHNEVAPTERRDKQRTRVRVNLVTMRDGIRKRWPLLRSIFNVKAFDYILKPLLENTDLPVLRIKDEWLGWRITKAPYGK